MNDPQHQSQLPVTTQLHTKNISPYLSYICIVASCFFWVTGYLYCNQHNIGPTQLSIVRGTILAFVSYGICKYNKKELDLRLIIRKQIFLRNILFIFHGFIVALSQFYLPLYVVHTIGNFCVVAVIILDYFIDGKTISRNKLGWLCLAFLGIIIIGNRALIFQIITGKTQENQSSFQNYKSSNPLVISVVSLVLLAALTMQAIAIKITQKAKLSPQQINLSFGMMLACSASITYFYLPVKSPPQILYPAFLWTGVTLSLAQTFFITGIVLSTQVGISMTVSNLTILIAYLYSLVRYSEPLSYICLISSVVTVFALAKILIK